MAKTKRKAKKNKSTDKGWLIKMKDKLGLSMAPTYKVYASFCKETTLHGLKHTVAENLHWFERCLWFVLTVCAFGGAVYCALSQLSRYSSEPVVVSLQRDYRRWWTTFPAVTACFINRVDSDKAREAIETLWNVTEESDPEKYAYYYGFVELVSDVSFRTNLQNFWKYQNDDTVKDIDLMQLAVTVHPTLPLKVMTSQLKEVTWISVMTEVGMCMTFNSEYSQYQFTMLDVDWTGEELLQCHYHSGQCFVRIDSMDNAIRYFVHSPFEISTAISNPTGEILPGEELIIDFKVVEIRSSSSVKTLRPVQRRCRYPDEWLSNSIQAYSFGLCQMHCRSRMALMFCGCRPYFHVKGGSIMLYRLALLINMNESDAATSGDSSLAAVRFNLMPPKFRLHRDIIFTLEDLFASLGGTTALFVGASVLTVLETGLFVVRQLVSIMFGSRGSRGRVVEFKP